MASDRGVRKTCLSGGGNCAQRHGSYAANKGGCCCSAEQCTKAWKAVPCFAGECVGSLCGCPSCYPIKEIYVCTDARCNCDGSAIWQDWVIEAGYDAAPDVKYCFKVLNKPTDPVYDVIDIQNSETIVGFGTKCVTCRPLGCSVQGCPPARGRWVRPSRCNPQRGGANNPPCPWVCPNKISTACSVLKPDTYGCCTFAGGIAEEGFFPGCPPGDYYPTNLTWGGPIKTCCECETDCNGIIVYHAGVPNDCPSNMVCSQVNPDPTNCCCGQCPGASVTFSWENHVVQFGQDNYLKYSGTCDCEGNGVVKVEAQQFGVYSTENRPCNGFYPIYPFSQSACPSMDIGGFSGDTIAFGPDSCFGYCFDPVHQESNVTSGSITATCDAWRTNVRSDVLYNVQNGGYTRVETIVGFADFTRNVAAKCHKTCAGSVVGRPGFGRSVSKGSGRGAASGDFM